MDNRILSNLSEKIRNLRIKINFGLIREVLVLVRNIRLTIVYHASVFVPITVNMMGLPPLLKLYLIPIIYLLMLYWIIVTELKHNKRIDLVSGKTLI